MDPNATLAELRDICRPIDRGEYDADGSCETRIAELVVVLDEWLTKGGFLPGDWTLRGNITGLHRANVTPEAAMTLLVVLGDDVARGVQLPESPGQRFIEALTMAMLVAEPGQLAALAVVYPAMASAVAEWRSAETAFIYAKARRRA